jgi:tetratricopeptide (TPR) repeat protein
MAAARAWRTAGNTSAAERCYRNAVSKSGCYSELWLEYVHFLAETRGVDEAAGEVALRHSLVYQGPPIADEVFAQAWEIVGRSDLAIPHYLAAARRDDRDVAALAIVLARQGRVENAVAIVGDERWSVSTASRARAAAIVGVNAVDLSAASKTSIMQIVEEGVTTTNDDVALLLAAVEWYTKCQASSAAIEMLQRVVTLQPDNVVAANNLAMLLADEQCDFEQALEYIDNVLKQSGAVSEFLDTKGWILVRMNRAEEALPWLTKAADGSSSADPIAQLHLATAYLALGDRDHAQEYLELARAGQIRPELLNISEQRAWETLQREFTQQALTQGDSDA